jgi:adenine-specific DNA-methyltransferase
MARRTTPKEPKAIDAFHHDKATRTNIPTADAYEFASEAAVAPVVFERDPSLDPQLVWRGKYADDVTGLVAEVPPIYIQEKIDPRVLVENLRETQGGGPGEPELTLFDGFDGLDELDSIDFYQHQANWSNRMILGDSLQIMASLAEREDLRGKVQMIYIDPPYGIKFGSNWQSSTRSRSVSDGKLSDAAREAEQIKAFRDTWELGIHSYLSYLRDRLTVARDLLTESGSVFVQIGDENAHLIRSVLDEVFGSANFVVNLVFKKKSATTPTDPVNDHIIWYAKSRDNVRARATVEARRAPEAGSKFNTLISRDGAFHRTSRMSEVEIAELEAAGAEWARVNYPLVSQDVSGRSVPFDWKGKSFTCGKNAHWRFDPETQMRTLALAGRLFDGGGRSLGGVMRWSDWPYVTRSNIWTDVHSEQNPVYVVQTHTRVIERCMLMCTDPGDLVLDPTCGSGTTAYVAEQWGRRWITMDTSRVALTLARQRLMGAKYPYYHLADSDKGRETEMKASGKPLPPAQTTNDIRHGFVYERVQHITLKSIANNPDIVEGLSREQIDAAIKKHAEFELLYDKPYEDKSVVRVSGPFTVESLSPHRSLAFAGSPDVAAEPNSERAAAEDADSMAFEQTILDNLAKAGIQNGRRAERIEFESVDRHPGLYVQAVGTTRSSSEGSEIEGPPAPGRIAIAVGPQYGTVDPGFIKNAAREAIKAEADLLCVLGFAFDPQATGVTEDDNVTIEASRDGFDVAGERSLGRVKALLVRMNVDLLMGEALKKTGAGNLFTVFGEPDIDITRNDDNTLTVELRGVDVYDPTTGEVRSDDTGRIALWMIDTNYNGESFFVRHCYFTGGNDPFKRLKVALKAEIDADAWAALNSTTSRPFETPETGKIAVKVINDYGDEVMKVFTIE